MNDKQGAQVALDNLDRALTAKFGVPYLTHKLERLLAEHRAKRGIVVPKPRGADLGRRTYRDKPGRNLINEAL